MSVSYFLNWCGPVCLSWYEKRGLLDSKKEIITRYASGRIDIRGLSEGWHEYDVPPMQVASWNLLSDWLDVLETDNLLEYEKLLEKFEKDTGHRILWYKNIGKQND
jgi:hypothetical protein